MSAGVAWLVRLVLGQVFLLAGAGLVDGSVGVGIGRLWVGVQYYYTIKIYYTEVYSRILCDAIEYSVLADRTRSHNTTPNMSPSGLCSSPDSFPIKSCSNLTWLQAGLAGDHNFGTLIPWYPYTMLPSVQTALQQMIISWYCNIRSHDMPHHAILYFTILHHTLL